MTKQFSIPSWLAETAKVALSVIGHSYIENKDGSLDGSVLDEDWSALEAALVAKCRKLAWGVFAQTYVERRDPYFVVVWVGKMVRDRMDRTDVPYIAESTPLEAWIKAAEWARKQPPQPQPQPQPEYDYLTHWKSDDGRIKKFADLDKNHLYNILNKRRKEPDWHGFVPKDKVTVVFTALWKEARKRCHAEEGTVRMGPYSATDGAKMDVPGTMWTFWKDGRVWIADDPEAANVSHSYINESGGILGTIREVRDGLVYLNVLPHMVTWAVKNMTPAKPQSQSQPQPNVVDLVKPGMDMAKLVTPQPVTPQPQDELRAEFNRKLDEMSARISPVIAEITKTLETLKADDVKEAIRVLQIRMDKERVDRHQSIDARINRIDNDFGRVINRIESDVERNAATLRADMRGELADVAMDVRHFARRLDDHAAQISVLRGALEHTLRGQQTPPKPRVWPKRLWRWLPWILTAAVGLGLGIANHYEGWITMEWHDEASTR